MSKEIISSRQAIAIIVVFIFGSSVVMGVSSDLCQDSWIGFVVAVLLTIPTIIIYARIIKLYPGKDLYDIAEELFGKIFSKIIILMITWYAIHLGALVLKNFSEFTMVTALLDTPELVLMLVMIIATTYLAKSGVESLGRWAIVTFVIVTGVAAMTVVLSAPNMNFNNFLPVANHSLSSIAKASYNIFTFPFAETILFLTLASSIKKKDSPYKIYLYAILIAALILLMIMVRNLTILGTPMVKSVYFPSYITARLISLGDFLTRVENTITINFILAGLIKITVCLIAASKGVAHLFKIKDYKFMTIPVSLIVLALSSTLYNNITEMFEFIPVYSIYAIPFQIIIPLLVWITAEIKFRIKKAKVQR